MLMCLLFGGGTPAAVQAAWKCRSHLCESQILNSFRLAPARTYAADSDLAWDRGPQLTRAAGEATVTCRLLCTGAGAAVRGAVLGCRSATHAATGRIKRAACGLLQRPGLPAEPACSAAAVCCGRWQGVSEPPRGQQGAGESPRAHVWRCPAAD